ncbi:MAG TPA: hypothetical protein VJ743_14205 [Albitalea sp.]|nr:hypothetical protein [Albitalea sp.]
MSSTFVPRAPSILKRPVAEPRSIPAAPVRPARNFQVLQSSRAPAQLCLFQRSGAIDVK